MKISIQIGESIQIAAEAKTHENRYLLIATSGGLNQQRTGNNKAGEDYEGGQDLDDFVAFINKKCGTNRDAKGKLTAKAGIVETLDTLVKEFVSAGNDEKKAVYDRMGEEIKKLEGSAARYGNIYLKAAKSCMEKGGDYAKNEIKRLERMLSKDISMTKADEFALKKNILSAFA